MARRRDKGRVNVKLILILLGVVVVLGVAAVVARHVRRKILAERDLAAGNAAYEKQDWNTARKHFQEYLGRRPEDADVMRKYAEALLSMEPLERKRILQAIWAYRQLMNLTPDDAEVYRKLARLYTRVRDFGELAYVARKRLDLAGGDAEATIWLGRALAARQKHDQARELLTALAERLEKEDPTAEWLVDAYVLLGGVASRQGGESAPAETLKWLDRAVACGAGSPEALVARARFLRTAPAFGSRTREAMLALARKDLVRAGKLARPDPRTTLALVGEWIHHGELDRAGALLEGLGEVDEATIREDFVDADDWVIARFDTSAELWLRRGRAGQGANEADDVLAGLTEKHKRLAALPQAVRLYVTAGQVEKARKHLDEYVELRRVLEVSGGEKERLAILRARVAGAEGKSEEVIDLLGPLADRGDCSAEVLRMVGLAYSQSGQPVRAAGALERYLRKSPGDGRMWLVLARQRGRRGDWAGALQAAGRAETLDKNDVTAALTRIEAAVRMAGDRTHTKRQQALAELARELAELRNAHPRLPQVRSLQGHVAILQGRRDHAEQILARAIEDLPQSMELKLQLVGLHAAGGRRQEALSLCRAALEAHGQVADPWQALAKLHRAGGKPDEARAVLRRGLKAVSGAKDRRTLKLDLAILDILSGDRAAGIDLLKKLAAADARDVQTRSLLLDLPEVRRDGPAARKLLDEIRAIRGESSLLWRRHQAAVWFTGHRWRTRRQQIAETLEEWIRQNPRWPLPAVLLGRMHERLGEPEKAEQVYRHVLAANPSALQAADLLVGLLNKQNRRADARGVLDDLQISAKALSARRVRLAIGEGDTDAAIRGLKLQAASDPRDAAARILLAQLSYRRSGDLRAALSYLDEADAVRPGSPLVLSARVAILAADGKADQARELLDAEVKRTGSPSAHLMRARFLADAGLTDAAEKDYLKLVKLDPSARCRQLLARFYQRDNRLAEAVESLRRGLKDDPNSLAVKRALLDLLIRRKAGGDLAEAEKILDDLGGRLGEKPDLLWARAALLMARSAASGTQVEYGAARMLERLVELEPTSVRGHAALIDLAVRAKDYVRARHLAGAALEANPGSIPLLLARVRVELASGRFKAAADRAGGVLKLAPESGEARAMLVAAAMNARRAEDLRYVHKAIRRAMEGAPENAGLHLGEAHILDALGRPAEAIGKLQAYAATKAGGGSAAVLLALARLCREQGDLPQSAAWLDRAASVSGGRGVGVLQERLRLRGAEGKFEEVISLAADHDSGGNPAASVLGAAASVLALSEVPKHRQEAERLYRRAASLAPRWPLPKAALAALLFHRGRVKQSAAVYREILSLDPDNVHALNGLAWILSESDKKHAAALSLADRAVRLDPDNRHALDTRGVILSHMPGRLGDARKEFEKCVALTAPGSGERALALLKLGRLCARAHDAGCARKRLAEAIRIDREHHVLSEEDREEAAEILKSLSAATAPHGAASRAKQPPGPH